jgi:hypothetical protein
MIASTAYRPLTITRIPEGIAITVAWIAADGSQATRDYLVGPVRTMDGCRLAQATYERADGTRATLTDRRKRAALAAMVDAWEGERR